MNGKHVHRVENLVHLRRYAEAREALRPLIAEDPNDTDLHGLHAQILIGLEDWPAALDAGNRVVALAPDDEWGHRICSIVLRNLKIHEGAVHAAAAAVRLAPLHWQPHQQFAISAAAIPRLRMDAAAAAARAVELAPNEPGTHFTLGLVAESRLQHDLARAAYQRTLALDPDHAAAQNNLTNLDSRLSLGRLARGYSSALQKDPSLGVARENLDHLAFRLVRRFYWAAIAGLILALAVAGIEGGFEEPGFSLVRATVGVVLIVATAAYTWSLARQVPRGVRTHVRQQLVKQTFLLLTTLLSLLMILVALIACFVPEGPVWALPGLRILGLFNVALIVGAVLRRRNEEFGG